MVDASSRGPFASIIIVILLLIITSSSVYFSKFFFSIVDVPWYGEARTLR
jgi:hypothetical protein